MHRLLYLLAMGCEAFRQNDFHQRLLQIPRPKGCSLLRFLFAGLLELGSESGSLATVRLKKSQLHVGPY